MSMLDVIPDQALKALLAGFSPARLWELRPSRVLSVCVFMLIASILLGGGTHGGFLSDAVLELLAIPALIMAVMSFSALPAWRREDTADVVWPLAFCVAVALVPLIQLIPLPSFIWTRLPGRDEMVQIYGLLGDELPWRPISIAPSITWQSFLSLLPPMTIFLAAIQLTYQERRQLSLAIVAIGVVSTVLGLLQVAQGPASPWRFFVVTNSNEAVGFFANRNHLAALMYVVLLYAAAWAIDIAYRLGSWTDLKSFDTSRILTLTGSLLAMVVIIATEATARSRAGLALTILALVAIYVMAFANQRGESGGRITKLVIAVTALGILVVVQFGLYRILDRFSNDTLVSGRSIFAHNTIHAALAFMPVGAGMGTFVSAYQMFENPGDILANIYANRAHNDFLELWLETGIMGPILIGLFAVWFGRRLIRLWRQRRVAAALDENLVRAAAAAIILLLLHSVVDYPMRTDAIMAVFAISCALLIKPLRHEAPEEQSDMLPAPVHARGLPGGRPKPSIPVLPERKAPAPGKGTTLPQPVVSGRWGDDVEWPEAWRQGAADKTEPKNDTKTDAKSVEAAWGEPQKKPFEPS